MTSLSLEGKTAVVTGSSSGIGEEIALQFADAGANLVVNSRDKDRAESTAQSIRNRGSSAVGVAADTSDKNALTGLVDAAVDEFGGIDVMINNAGQINVTPALEITEAEWRHIIDVNLSGVFFGSQVAAERMIECESGGQIINITSIYGSVGVQGRASYNASKGGVNNLTRCLAIEFAEHDIQVNALAPGFVRTDINQETRQEGEAESEGEMNSPEDWPYYSYDDQHIRNRTPLNRYGTLEEIGKCALFLASGEHYMTGEVMTADGGYTAFGWGSKGT